MRNKFKTGNSSLEVCKFRSKEEKNAEVDSENAGSDLLLGRQKVMWKVLQTLIIKI